MGVGPIPHVKEMPCHRCGAWVPNPQYRVFYGRKLPRFYQLEEGPIIRVIWVTECKPSCHAAKAMVKLETCWRHYKKLHETMRTEPLHQIRARGLKIIEENGRNLHQLRFHIQGLAEELEAEQERCHFRFQDHFRVPPPPERPPEEYYPPPSGGRREPEASSGGYPSGVEDTRKRIAALAVEIEEIQQQQQRQQRAAEEEVVAKRQLRQELILANSVLV